MIVGMNRIHTSPIATNYKLGFELSRADGLNNCIQNTLYGRL